MLGRPLKPTTLCTYEIDAEPVFDALDPSHRDAYGVGTIDLLCPNLELDMLAGNVPASQRSADRLIEARYAGIRVQSIAHGAENDNCNMVFWHWGSRGPSKVVLIDDEERLLKSI